MRAGFDAAVALVLNLEGGYANDARDQGGETKYGISKNAYPSLDIAALTEDDARAIYRKDYWDRLRCDELPPALALVIFDTGVNMGRMRAITLLQNALGIGVDGTMGPVTMASAARATDATVLDYCSLRAVVYASLSDFTFFGRNWMRRLLTVYGAALKEAVS